MRMLLTVEFPVEPFNTYVREGSAGGLLVEILEDLKPEAAYFTEEGGARSAILAIDVSSASDVTRHAEPFFLKFEANCHFRIAMTAEEVGGAGLEELGTKWG